MHRTLPRDCEGVEAIPLRSRRAADVFEVGRDLLGS